MDRVAEGLHVPRNRGSLFVPRTATISGHYSPRAPRSTKFPTSGGDGEAPRFKSRKGASTKKQRTTTESTIGGGSGSEDEDERKHFPWMNAIVLLNSSTIFLCGHQENCPYNCHFRQSQSCRRLLKALRTVYSDPSDSHQVGVLLLSCLVSLVLRHFLTLRRGAVIQGQALMTLSSRAAQKKRTQWWPREELSVFYSFTNNCIIS